MSERERQADRAAAAGDLATAAALLESETQVRPDDAQLWMKLAALRRAAGQPVKALEAVNQALRFSELDFIALTVKATLIDQLSPDHAGEAWAHALAQRPDQPLPPQMEPIIAHGQAVHAKWVAANTVRLDAATAAAEAQASDEERDRIERFKSNTLRKTHVYHSEPTHFAFPGLTEREFHPRSEHPWLDRLEAATEDFTAELQAVMSAERAELVPYIQYFEHEPLAQWRPLNKNPDWTAIHLLRNGQQVEANAKHCPKILTFLSELPQPDIQGVGPSAMFSLLAPHTEIPPHVGVSNARLVCHLPLVVPAGCWFRVGAETRYWEKGKAFVFDDTIEHEATNPSDELRIVFIFDIWHPGLSEVEREAVRRVIASEGAAGGGL